MERKKKSGEGTNQATMRNEGTGGANAASAQHGQLRKRRPLHLTLTVVDCVRHIDNHGRRIEWRVVTEVWEWQKERVLGGYMVPR